MESYNRNHLACKPSHEMYPHEGIQHTFPCIQLNLHAHLKRVWPYSFWGPLASRDVLVSTWSTAAQIAWSLTVPPARQISTFHELTLSFPNSPLTLTEDHEIMTHSHSIFQLIHDQLQPTKNVSTIVQMEKKLTSVQIIKLIKMLAFSTYPCSCPSPSSRSFCWSCGIILTIGIFSRYPFWWRRFWNIFPKRKREGELECSWGTIITY